MCHESTKERPRVQIPVRSTFSHSDLLIYLIANTENCNKNQIEEESIDLFDLSTDKAVGTGRGGG